MWPISTYSLSIHRLGHYVYIETSSCTAGDVAKLVSPLLGAKARCLSFYYNMYGATIKTLRVKVGNQLMWELTGDQGQKWYKATVPLNFTDLFQVMLFSLIIICVLCP